MRQYKKLSKFWQGKNIKTSVFRTCILITQNTEQVLRISELLSVIQNSYIYGNHGNLKMELTLPVPSCYQSLNFVRRLELGKKKIIRDNIFCFLILLTISYHITIKIINN